MIDITIIGAGAIGCAAAYELSKYNVNVLLLEKENDVSLGASRANTAIVHGGYDPDPESLMGKFNAKGAKRCFELAKELQIECKKTGSLIIAFTKEDLELLEIYLQRGIQNGVPGLEILEAEEVHRREPNLSENVIGALWVPESGVINPWELTIAFAEVAVRNGVDLQLNQEVQSIRKEDNCYLIKTQTQEIKTKYVINAAGVHSAEIHEMIAEPAFKITPTKGQYFLLDGGVNGTIVNSVIFPCPTKLTKGILVSPTIHTNTLIGPDAEAMDNAEDTSTTRQGLDTVINGAKRAVPSLNFSTNIRNYAGIRANSDYGDFYIKMIQPNFLDLAAIKSPGLTCAPVIAEMAVEMLVEEGLAMNPKEHWQGGRELIRFKELPFEEKQKAISENPLYGRIICRCEHITEGEIVDAIHRELPVVSLDGIKRRTGAGLGRCQGGFCAPKVLQIIARETGLSIEEITQDKAGGFVIKEKFEKREKAVKGDE